MNTGQTQVDPNTLQWVKSEIDETLKQARHSLEVAVDTPDDHSQLPVVADYLHQVRGTLQIVELYGASMVADELEQLAKDLSEKRIEARDEVYEVLMRAMLQLPDYLERLQAGYKDIPMVLLPLLNDLRAARGKPLLSESALFNPDLAVEFPVPSARAQQDSLPALAKRLRHTYHLGLLDWYQDRDTVAGLDRLDQVIQQLREAANDREVSRVLWSASGVLEALRQGGLEASVAVKLLLGQVDRQIKKIIDHGESALAQEPPTELEKNLLYYVASSTTDGERVSALKKTFRLNEALPDTETLEQARADLSGPNADLMQTVSTVLLENLLRVKDALDVFVHAAQRDNRSLKQQCEELDQLSETLGMLGFGEQRQLIQEQIDILTAMSQSDEPIDEAALMGVAEVLLSVEAALQAAAAPGAEEQPIPAAADADDALQYELVSSVMAEAKSEMGRVKEAISAFIETPANIELLSDVPSQLESIGGGFNMLSLERPAGVMRQCRDYIQSELIEQSRRPEPSIVDALADTLSSIEYYMDSLVGKWGNPQAILDVAEQRLRHITEPMVPEPPEGEASAEMDDQIAAEDLQLSVEPDAAMVEPEQEQEQETEQESGPVNEFAAEDETPDMAMEAESESIAEPPAGIEDLEPAAAEQQLEQLPETVESEPMAEEQEPELEPSLENELAAPEEEAAQEEQLEQAPEAAESESLAEEQEPEPEGSTDSQFTAPAEETLQEEQAEQLPETTEFESIAEGQELEPEASPDSQFIAAAEETLQEDQAEPSPEVAGSEAMAGEQVPEPEASQDERLASTAEETAPPPMEDAALQAGQAEEVLAAGVASRQAVTEQPGEAAQLQNLAQLLAGWYENVHAMDTVTPVREAIAGLKDLTVERSMAEAGRLITDLDALVRSVHKGETTLNDDVKNSLHFALDTLNDILVGETEQAATEEAALEAEPLTEPASPPAEIDEDIIQVFLEEANEELEKINQLLPRWQQDPSDEAALQGLRRSFHTLKGSGRLVGATDLGEFAWAFEGLLNRVIDGSIQTNPALSVALEEARQELPQMFERFRQGEPPGQQARDLMAFARQLASGEELAAEDAEEAATADRDEAAAEEAATTADVIPAIEAALLSIYRKELDSHLASLQQYVQDWNAGGDRSANQRLIRALHTLSGSSRTAAVTPLAEVFGQMEKYALHLSSSGLDLGPQGLAVLEAAMHYAQQLLPLLDAAGAAMPEYASLCAQIEALYASEGSPVALAAATDTQVLGQEEQAQTPAAVPDSEVLDIFIEEGMEHLDESDHVLHRWSQDRANPDYLDTVQRLMHTLKGGARLAQLSEIGDLSHAVESMLTALLEGRLQADEEFFELMLQAQDALVQMIEQARLRQPLASAQGLIQAIEGLLAAPPGAAAEQAPADAETEAAEEPLPDNVVPLVRLSTAEEETAEPMAAQPGEGMARELARVKLDLLDRLVNFAGEVSVYRSRLELQNSSFGNNLQELGDTVNRLRDQLRQFEIEAEAQIQYRNEDSLSSSQEEFDPLEFDRFTHMQQLSRSMMESLSDLDSLRGILADLSRDTETLLVQQSRVNSELQEGLMRTRMVPLSSQAGRLRRIVRQTAQDMGKKAELHLQGAELELDRHVLERLLPALDHMLRNAVAHGIEYPAERQTAGKPETGQVELGLTREGGNIILQVRDDGTGIDLEAVRAKAVEKGRVSRDEQPSRAQLCEMILESGFTTVDEVTQIAGRGVGMDVVNNEIKQLGGALNIDSEDGVGASFTISLPVSLSVTRALMVTVGEETYALPLLSVEGIERISGEELQRLYAEGKPVLQRLGEDYPLVHLASVMDVPRSDSGQQSDKLPLLLVHSGEYRAAVQVDSLTGSREIVVNPVGPQLSTLRGISGATIMGDGRVVLVIDLGMMIRLGTLWEEQAPAAGELSAEQAQLPLVMVVDDSITVRKVTSGLLKRNHYRAVTAKDGVDALTQLQELSPDIILLDVEMPRMDGFEFVKNIRNDEQLQATPIIMITSRTGQKHRERAEAIGVNAYIGKPFEEAELLETIHRLLSHEQ